MTQKATFISHYTPKPPTIKREYDEDVLDLEACEVIIEQHRLSKLQKLWLLNLKNRDGILELNEEFGEVIITLRTENEKDLVVNARIVYELEQELLYSDDYERKKHILNTYMNGGFLKDLFISNVYDALKLKVMSKGKPLKRFMVVDEIYDPNDNVSYDTIHTPVGQRNIMCIYGDSVLSSGMLNLLSASDSSL